MDDAGRVTFAVPCRTDEPALGQALTGFWEAWRSTPSTRARGLECLVCVNGPGADAAPVLSALRAFAASAGTTVDDPAAEAPLAVRVLRTERTGKAIAWTLLRAAVRTPLVVFLDADVRVSVDGPARLLEALAAHPAAVLATPRTTCTARASAFERIMAAPYGVAFPNLSGQLYAARTAGLPATMPEDLIEPERWLELEVGCERVVAAPGATVSVRPPANLGDFFRQRIRIEMGKVQLALEYPALLGRSAPQPRAGAAVRALPVSELVRLGVYLALREVAHGIAWWRYRRGRTAGVWVQAASTKEWGDTR